MSYTYRRSYAGPLRAVIFDWAGTTVETNFICSLGYADSASFNPRAPKLSFEEAAAVL